MLPDLCRCHLGDDPVPSLRVPLSDKTTQQNWGCGIHPLGASSYAVAPSLGQSLVGLLSGKTWCVCPPCAANAPDFDLDPASEDNGPMEKSKSCVLGGFGDHLFVSGHSPPYRTHTHHYIYFLNLHLLLASAEAFLWPTGPLPACPMVSSLNSASSHPLPAAPPFSSPW